MLVLFLKGLGFILAHLPEACSRCLCVVVGHVIYWGLGRRYEVHANLHHAFPEKSKSWRGRIGRESIHRLVEWSLMPLVVPYWSDAEIRRRFVMPPLTHERMRVWTPYPVITLIPHLSLAESLTMIQWLEPSLPPSASLFRPLKPAAVDAYVQASRERFNIAMFSRREGLIKSRRHLAKGGWLGLLFDQNTGESGALVTFLGRVCSATDMGGALAAKENARVAMMWPERTGFWQADIQFEPLEGTVGAVETTLASHRWLEQYLQSSDAHCQNWMWCHRRWKTQHQPGKRLRLEHKKNFLVADMEARGLQQLPKKHRLWIRLPNWLGDVVMALPLIQALRESRPDAEITLLAQAKFCKLLKQWQVGDRVIELPTKGLGYYRFFAKLKDEFPDTYLLFTNSLRGDLEAWLTRCPMRIGMQRPGKKRPLLTHQWALSPELDETQQHQTAVWAEWLKQFGLLRPMQKAPLITRSHCENQIGLICGTENSPEKRWPVEHWRSLIEKLLYSDMLTTLHLYGTKTDREITQLVQAGFDPEKVVDRAGQTSLPEFADELSRCRVVICNDTGGMHLANALGVPVVALFGPTNPVRTGPVFDAPIDILQPPDCPATGGRAMNELLPEKVFAVVKEHLHKAAHTH